MKVGIPAKIKDINENINDSLSRGEYFLVYDLDSDEYEFVGNEAANAPRGAGIQAAQILLDSGVKALITLQCGMKAADVLKEGNIKIYKGEEDTLKSNIEKLKQGELEILNEIHDGHHGGV